jgi:hypothetical protein
MNFNFFKKKVKKQEPPFWPPLLEDNGLYPEEAPNGFMAVLTAKSNYIKAPEGYVPKPVSRLNKVKRWVIQLLNRMHLCR